MLVDIYNMVMTCRYVFPCFNALLKCSNSRRRRAREHKRESASWEVLYKEMHLDEHLYFLPQKWHVKLSNTASKNLAKTQQFRSQTHQFPWTSINTLVLLLLRTIFQYSNPLQYREIAYVKATTVWEPCLKELSAPFLAPHATALSRTQNTTQISISKDSETTRPSQIHDCKWHPSNLSSARFLPYTEP